MNALHRIVRSKELEENYPARMDYTEDTTVDIVRIFATERHVIFSIPFFVHDLFPFTLQQNRDQLLEVIKALGLDFHKVACKLLDCFFKAYNIVRIVG